MKALGYVLKPAAFGHLQRAHGEFNDVPLLDGLARDGSLLGLLTAEEFHHIGAGIYQQQSDVCAIMSEAY